MSLAFLEQLAQMQVQLGAFGELLVHIVEAALRHKQCPSNFLMQISQFLDDLTEDSAGPVSGYPLANENRMQRRNMQRRFLLKKLQEACALAEQPQVDRPVSIRVLYCTKLPQVMLDTKQWAPPAPIAEIEEAPGANLQSDLDAQPRASMASQTKELAYLASVPPNGRFY